MSFWMRLFVAGSSSPVKPVNSRGRSRASRRSRLTAAFSRIWCARSGNTSSETITAITPPSATSEERVMADSIGPSPNCPASRSTSTAENGATRKFGLNAATQRQRRNRQRQDAGLRERRPVRNQDADDRRIHGAADRADDVLRASRAPIRRRSRCVTTMAVMIIQRPCSGSCRTLAATIRQQAGRRHARGRSASAACRSSPGHEYVARSPRGP